MRISITALGDGDGDGGQKILFPLGLITGPIAGPVTGYPIRDFVGLLMVLHMETGLASLEGISIRDGRGD